MCHKFGLQANPVKYSIPNEGRKADDFGIISSPADSDGELSFHVELRFAKLEARAAHVAARIERQ